MIPAPAKLSGQPDSSISRAGIYHKGREDGASLAALVAAFGKNLASDTAYLSMKCQEECGQGTKAPEDTGGDKMGQPIGFRLFVLCAACLSFHFTAGYCLAVDPPPYEIILRSRSGTVTPERTRVAQTGGGFIQILQIEPNQVLVLMRGATAAGTPLTGSGHREASASLEFDLRQDFEVVPTRAGLRPPRLFLSAWLIGTLISSQEEKGGNANQAPACASILSADQSLLNVCIKPHSVTGRQNLLVNDRVGPLELTIAPGGYCLQQTFALSAFQPKYHCHSGSAAADFDPDPRLDTRWNDVLKPFRAAPHQDFGFRIILQAVEKPPPSGVVIPETLHRPKPEEKKKPPAENKLPEP